MGRQFLFVVSVIICAAVCSGKTGNNVEDIFEETVDKLRKDIMLSIPTQETNALLSQMLERPLKEQNVVVKKKIFAFKASLSKEELPTKKSTEALVPAEYASALDIALMNSDVYLTSKRKANILEPEASQAVRLADKRFSITKAAIQPRKKSEKFPRNLPAQSAQTMSSVNKPNTSEDSPITSEVSSSTFEKSPMAHEINGTAVSETRTKRQDDDVLDAQSPTADSIADGETDPVHQYDAVEPTGNVRDQEVNVRSDVNDGRVVAFLPETPIMSTTPSYALAMNLRLPPSSVQGTQRSVLPITRLLRPQYRHSLVTTTPVISSQVRKLLARFQGDDVITMGHQHGRFKYITRQPEKENPVIKLAEVPVRVLSSNSDDSKEVGKKKEKIPQDIIDEDTLKSLQSKLTSIISKLEEKVKNKAEKQEKKKTSKNKKVEKAAVSEKSLKVLKKKLSRVLKKFKSKPAAGQPFTMGKEWSHLLDPKRFNQASHPTKVSGISQEGSWPSIASQLLRKLNKVLDKLQERKEVHALEKNAVMYFSFDTEESTKNYKNLVADKSGHFNDAKLLDKAHISSRTYGSCGKALILNSGSLRYMNRYFKTKSTKAISLAMWVRTNATGYVRWFARDASPSREFTTSTKYPLVRKNVWTHLCGTFNSATGITRIYVDGELNTEKVNRQETTVPADFTPAGIGSLFGDDNLIAVDEVYMFSRALGEKEVQDIYDDCEFNRMVLHYGFQKINRTAGVVFDQSGLSNDAQLKGDADIMDGGCDKCGSCLDLNAKGNPRLMIQGNKFKHRPTKAISFATWLNLNSTIGTHPLLVVTEPATKGPLVDLHVTDGKLSWTARDKKQNPIFTLTTEQSVIPEGIWVHVIVTFDSVSGLAKIFVDGHQKAIAKSAKKIPIGGDWGETLVGGTSAGSRDFQGGYMDELAMYNWELDASEISYVMKYCPDHPKLVSFTVHIPLE